MRLTQADRRRAAVILVAWREDDVPAILTAHEAHHLTSGAAGREGDHDATVSAARAALLQAREERRRREARA
jgi:hypothetical protein